VKIANGFAETAVFQARAQLAAGGAKLRVVARARGPAGAFEVKDEVDVPFLPAGPRERAIQKRSGSTPGARSRGPGDRAQELGADSETTTFWMTTNPYGESFDHLGYLIHYPYGCIEQTTSSTRPLLYVASLVEQVDPQLAEAKIEDMVLAGVNRVFTMQTRRAGSATGRARPSRWSGRRRTRPTCCSMRRRPATPCPTTGSRR